MGKTIECPVHAKIVPFSSVVGQSVMLTDETGAVVAHISISIPSPSYPYRETAGEVACIIETAINRPPSEQIKNLRVRLGKLMADEAKRMAASELATPSPAPVSAPTTDGEVDRLRHERDCLAHAIGEAALKAGITAPGAALTGPMLMMLCDDLATAALSNPAPGHGEAVPVAWQPIDTVPSDGRKIEVTDRDGHVLKSYANPEAVSYHKQHYSAWRRPHPATGEKPAPATGKECDTSAIQESRSHD